MDVITAAKRPRVLFIIHDVYQEDNSSHGSAIHGALKRA